MKKFGRILIALLPMIGAILLQNITMYYYMLKDGMEGKDIAVLSKDPVYQKALSDKSFLTYAIIGVVVFGLWYLVGARNTRYQKQKPTFTIAAIVGIVLFGVSLQFCTSSVLSIVDHFFPEIMKGYAEGLQESNIGQWNTISFCCTVLLAPALEEFVFRGMTIHFLKKGSLNFYIVNLLQALFFGVFHMNVIQGIYAFAIGLVLGFLYYKYNAILVPILVHLCVNLTGMLLQLWQDKLPQSMKAVYIMGLVSLAVFGISFLIVGKDKPRVDVMAYDYE